MDGRLRPTAATRQRLATPRPGGRVRGDGSGRTGPGDMARPNLTGYERTFYMMSPQAVHDGSTSSSTDSVRRRPTLARNPYRLWLRTKGTPNMLWLGIDTPMSAGVVLGVCEQSRKAVAAGPGRGQEREDQG